MSTDTVQLEILNSLKELSEDIKQRKVAVPKRHSPRKTRDHKNTPPHQGTSKHY